MSVAGYLSTPEQWSLFENEWRIELDRWNLEFFHMTDFANRAKPYDSWSVTTRNLRFARLIEIIRTHVIASVGFVVPSEPYHYVMSDLAKRITGGAYGLAALACFMDAAKLLDPLYPSARIAYVFEAGTKGSGQILKAFEWNKKKPEQAKPLKLLSIRFEDKKEFAPLQAADMIAYELYRELPKKIGLDPYRTRREMRALAHDVTRSWGYMDEKEIRKWAELINLADDWN